MIAQGPNYVRESDFWDVTGQQLLKSISCRLLQVEKWCVSVVNWVCLGWRASHKWLFRLSWFNSDLPVFNSAVWICPAKYHFLPASSIWINYPCTTATIEISTEAKAPTDDMATAASSASQRTDFKVWISILCFNIVLSLQKWWAESTAQSKGIVASTELTILL